MQQHMGVGTPDLGRMRLILHQRVRGLEDERERLTGAIEEVRRRLAVIDEVLSWTVEGDGSSLETGTISNGDVKLVGMPLAAAITYLRREPPNADKQSVRERLDAIGYTFGVERQNVGRAVHAGWLAATNRMKAR